MFWSILVIFEVLRVFFFFLAHSSGFRGILVILEISGLFWSFKRFRGIFDGFEILGYFSRFRDFKGI